VENISKKDSEFSSHKYVFQAKKNNTKLFESVLYASHIQVNNMKGCFFENQQAEAALMYDAISVLHSAFTKILHKKGGSDFISSLRSLNGSTTSSTSSSSGSATASSRRDVVCATGRDFTDNPVPFEMGERIAKYIRKVLDD